MATLRMSRRSGQIGLKRCVYLTEVIANFVTGMVENCCINWHLTVAKCAEGAARICVAGCFNWTEGDPSLVSVTLHSRITLSPATCHPVQCRPNMRVADCSSVWVCKCLQLMHLTALHLTLFDIYSKISQRVCLGAMTIYQKLESLQTFWFDREHDAWWDLGPFEDKQAGLVQSMGAKGKNSWEAVEIGTW